MRILLSGPGLRVVSWRAFSTSSQSLAMGKNNRKKTGLPGEEYIHLPAHPSYREASSGIIDTHCHILSTYASYFSKYPAPKLPTVYDFVRAVYTVPNPPPILPDGTFGTPTHFERHAQLHLRVPDQKDGFRRHRIDAIIDVWCEAPVRKEWKELADSALTTEDRRQNWNGLDYFFVLGVHP